jgi:hypothetical protein
MVRFADDTLIAGLDDNPALDYVAEKLCPRTHQDVEPREVLARRLLRACRREARLSEIVTVTRLAEMLMGTTWVNLYSRESED